MNIIEKRLASDYRKLSFWGNGSREFYLRYLGSKDSLYTLSLCSYFFTTKELNEIQKTINDNKDDFSKKSLIKKIVIDNNIFYEELEDN